MKPALSFVFAALLSTAGNAQPVPGDLDVQWNPGAEDCEASPQPPLQVHRYDANTYILRQNPCADFEAPLLYLLIGDERAMLIDSGAVEDETAMPLAQTIAGLLPKPNGTPLPLLVTHTHRHSDHRAGDAQLAKLPGAEIVPIEPEAIVKFYGFKSWFNDTVKVDLGGRVVEAIAVPGHLRDHLLFYDPATALVFTGDFLLPGRLLVDDIDAYRASAERAVAYLKDKPVNAVLGGHVELGADGELFPAGSSYHPDERALALTKQDLEALPAALAGFNGFYSKYPNYVVVNPVRNLMVVAATTILVLGILFWLVRRWWKRRRTTGTRSAA